MIFSSYNEYVHKKKEQSTIPFRKKKKEKVKEATLTLKLAGVVKEATHRDGHIKG